MSILSKLFGRKKGEPEKAADEESEKPKLLAEGSEPVVIGFLSGKGGCGKSTIAANTTVLLSVLYKGVIAIDMDITNATLTQLMLALTPEILKEDDGISTIDYIVEGSNEYSLYKLEFPPNKRYNIQVAKKKNVGIPVKDIYFLPAKKATISYERNLSALAQLSRDEIRNSLYELYNNVLRFARSRGVKYVIFDFPPLRADQRKVYEGVFILLELIPSFIMISNFDFSAVHGLVGALSQRYSYLKPRTLGFFINMAVNDAEAKEKIRHYIETIYGKGTVFFIRRDPRWTVTIVPPIILGDPSEGAHFDLIYALTKLGIIKSEDVQKTLEFNPLELGQHQ